MKITKQKLKQIIKEEIDKMLENLDPEVIANNPQWTRGGTDPHTAAIDALDDAIHNDETYETIYNLLVDAQSKIKTTQGVAPGIPINDEDREYMLSQLSAVQRMVFGNKGKMRKEEHLELKNRITLARKNILDYEEEMNPRANDWMELY